MRINERLCAEARETFSSDRTWTCEVLEAFNLKNDGRPDLRAVSSPVLSEKDYPAAGSMKFGAPGEKSVYLAPFFWDGSRMTFVGEAIAVAKTPEEVFALKPKQVRYTDFERLLTLFSTAGSTYWIVLSLSRPSVARHQGPSETHEVYRLESGKARKVAEFVSSSGGEVASTHHTRYVFSKGPKGDPVIDQFTERSAQGTSASRKSIHHVWDGQKFVVQSEE
jgi:hypothetical protein